MPNTTRRVKLLIVDDEPLARMRLRSLLSDCLAPPAEVVGEAGSSAEALHLLSHLRVDGLLLDIHMPGMDGLALADKLRSLAQPPAVVFVTAHAEHALRAFEIDAVDYLTKPVPRGRLQEAVFRIGQRAGLVQGARPSAGGSESAAAQPVLIVTERGRVSRIPVSEVVYLRAELKYVTLRTRQRSYVLDEPLTDIERRLGAAVLRIHRNALVAPSAVSVLERRVLPGADAEETGEAWAVQTQPGGEWLAVSRRQLVAVRALLESGGA
jgi:two-component system response regulator AlgR